MPPWWIRAIIGALVLGYEVSPWNPAGFRFTVAIFVLGLLGVLSFVRLDLSRVVEAYLPPPPPAPPPAPPSLPGPPPGAPPDQAATDPTASP